MNCPLSNMSRGKKIAAGFGAALLLTVASATTFRLGTGRCPIQCVMEKVHGTANPS